MLSHSSTQEVKSCSLLPHRLNFVSYLSDRVSKQYVSSETRLGHRKNCGFGSLSPSPSGLSLSLPSLSPSLSDHMLRGKHAINLHHGEVHMLSNPGLLPTATECAVLQLTAQPQLRLQMPTELANILNASLRQTLIQNLPAKPKSLMHKLCESTNVCSKPSCFGMIFYTAIH